MAELADAPDLGSGSERSEGSSPFIRIVNCKNIVGAGSPRFLWKNQDFYKPAVGTSALPCTIATVPRHPARQPDDC